MNDTAPPETSPGRWRNSLELGTTILTALAAIAALVWFGSQWWLSKPPPPLPVPSELLSLDGVAWKGAPNAQAVIEFSDFECPFCGVFARESVPAIQRDIVDPQVARYGFVHYPITKIHKNAFRASEAAVCAGRQQKFWEMHDALFGSQDRLDEQSFFDRAAAIHLDATAFRECMAGKATAEVEAQKTLAERIGVAGTPTIYVGQVQPDGRLKVTHAIRAGPDALQQMQAALVPTASTGLWWAGGAAGLILGGLILVWRRRK